MLLGRYLPVKLHRRSVVIAEDAAIAVTRQLLLVVVGLFNRRNMEARDDVPTFSSE